jgi:hypothetical protein
MRMSEAESKLLTLVRDRGVARIETEAREAAEGLVRTGLVRHLSFADSARQYLVLAGPGYAMSTVMTPSHGIPKHT